jgi:hypothetical protein
MGATGKVTKKPNMDSSSFLGRSADWWNGMMLVTLVIAGIVAFLVAAATTGAVVATKREAVASQTELERYKLTVDGRIADAKREGIEAGKAAGNAVLRAAALEKEAQDLKAANLALQLQVQPRRLSGENSAKLISALAKLPALPIAVVSRLFDPEGADFADDLSNAFVAAHWEAVRQKDWTMSDRGVAFATFEGTSIPPDLATALRAALDTAGVKVDITTITKDQQNTTSAHFQANGLYLLVGAKP